MTISGQLQLGAVKILAPSTNELLGYAYTVESAGGQTQRWILYHNPQNELEIVSPPTSMAGWSLDDWQLNVRSLWRPGSFYVWAQTRLFHHGQTYNDVTWTSIPPASALPPPTYPKSPYDRYQLDPTPWKGLLIRQQDWTGHVYTVGGGLTADLSAEYWTLPAAYTPAGGALSTGVAEGTEEARSLQGFIDLSNTVWGPGAALAITGCINYQGEALPAWAGVSAAPALGLPGGSPAR